MPLPSAPEACRTLNNIALCCVQFRDDAGNEIGSKVCKIIGSDGGTLPYANDHPMPPTGLMVEVAYRWDIICDFSAYSQRVSPCHLSEHPIISFGSPSVTPCVKYAMQQCLPAAVSLAPSSAVRLSQSTLRIWLYCHLHVTVNVNARKWFASALPAFREGVHHLPLADVQAGCGSTEIHSLQQPSICRLCSVMTRVSVLPQAVYLVNEHQPDRTTSETPYFCYSHLLMKLNVGALDKGAQQPNLNATRMDGTDQQDQQLSPDYFDVSRDLKLLLHLKQREVAVPSCKLTCGASQHHSLPC
jgi:hypothetical protein